MKHQNTTVTVSKSPKKTSKKRENGTESWKRKNDGPQGLKQNPNLKFRVKGRMSIVRFEGWTRPPSTHVVQETYK